MLQQAHHCDCIFLLESLVARRHFSLCSWPTLLHVAKTVAHLHSVSPTVVAGLFGFCFVFLKKKDGKYLYVQSLLYKCIHLCAKYKLCIHVSQPLFDPIFIETYVPFT